MTRSSDAQRILRHGALLSFCALLLSLLLGDWLARIAAQKEIRTLLRYGGDGAGGGITESTSPVLMPDYPFFRLLMTAVLLGVSLLMIWICVLIALRRIKSIYRDIDLIYQDCLRLADDFDAELTMRGDEAGVVRRLCGGIGQLANRTGYLAQQAFAEQKQLHHFIVDVSHQMKTALSVVRLNRDMLDTLDLPETERTRLSDEIAMQLDATEKLILETLDLAKLHAGAVEYNRTETDLAETCRMAAARVEPLCRQQQIEIAVICEQEPVFPHDRTWLCEAICNLLKNAADHAACTRLEVELSVLPDAVRLTVTDNGIGISPEQIFHLFERFRAPQQPSRMQNTGVGLAIAKQIFEAHGGMLCVFSDSRGTQFFSMLRQHSA